MSLQVGNLKMNTLQEYLNKECDDVESFINTFESKKDFIVLFKKLLHSQEVKVSDQAYNRLQIAIQSRRDDLYQPPLLMKSCDHLEFLLSSLFPDEANFSARFCRNEDSLRRQFREMIEQGKQRFGFAYFTKGYPTGHFFAIIFERKGNKLHALISDADASASILETIVQFEKALKEINTHSSINPITLKCYGFSQKRQIDNYSCSMFTLKDLLFFSKYPFISLITESSQHLIKEVKKKGYIYKDDGTENYYDHYIDYEVSFHLLDSFVDQLPSAYFKSSQTTEKRAKMEALVEVIKRVSQGYGSYSISKSYERVNFYTRYFNLKCLAFATDQKTQKK